MPNPYIPREQVHAWSEAIGRDQVAHQAALNRLLTDQRRLTKFLEHNQAELQPTTAGVALYLFGVLARIYDLAGGQLRKVTWDHIHAAAQRVSGATAELLPIDEAFPERVRAVAWRAQPHVLDEALMALFARETTDEEADLDDAEAGKVFFLMWVANEALDACWRAPRNFQGETEYTYAHIEPTPPEDAGEE